MAILQTLQNRRSGLRCSPGFVGLLFVITLLSFVLGSGLSAKNVFAAEERTQYHWFWRQENAEAFGKWMLRGTAVTGTGSVQLSPLKKGELVCAAEDIDGGKVSYDGVAGLCAGNDPMAPGSYNHMNYYNGGKFYYGTMVSPVVTTPKEVNSFVISWNATTPRGSWLQIHIRTLQNAIWTHWYKLPIWASDFSTVRRHSVDGQFDDGGSVATDTYLTGKKSATAYQVSVTLFSISPQIKPLVRRVTAIASYRANTVPVVEPERLTWGVNLPVPQRSQMLAEYRDKGYGGGGEAWCSPTSTSMVMAYWGNVLKSPKLNQRVPDAAQGAYDFTYRGTGNWPYNTAYAATFGLRAFVTRMYSLSQVEQWIKARVPIIISLAYQPGELPGSPIPSSDGHLLVVRGFAANGDVITNDPAGANNQKVAITYPRAKFQELWLRSSSGTVYVIYPEKWETPTAKVMGSW